MRGKFDPIYEEEPPQEIFTNQGGFRGPNSGHKGQTQQFGSPSHTLAGQSQTHQQQVPEKKKMQDIFSIPPTETYNHPPAETHHHPPKSQQNNYRDNNQVDSNQNNILARQQNVFSTDQSANKYNYLDHSHKSEIKQEIHFSNSSQNHNTRQYGLFYT